MDKKEIENKVQKTVMIDAVLDKIIQAEMKKQDRSYSAILCQLIRKGLNIG